MTFSRSGSGGWASGVTSFTGVDQTNPTDGNALGATGTSTTPTSAAKTGVIGDMLTDVVVANPITVADGGTQAWNDAGGDASQYKAASGAAQTTGWTSSNAAWVVVVALLKQAAAVPVSIAWIGA